MKRAKTWSEQPRAAVRTAARRSTARYGLLNASDIATQDFPVVRRGYAQDEVRAFLVRLSNDHRVASCDPAVIKAEARAQAEHLVDAATLAAHEIVERAEIDAAATRNAAEIALREAEVVHAEGVAAAHARAAEAAEHADRLLTEAEAHAAARLAEAERVARERSTVVLERAKQRLQRLLDAETDVHVRLSAAFSSINAPASCPLERDDELLDLAFTEFFASDIEHDESRAWILGDHAG